MTRDASQEHTKRLAGFAQFSSCVLYSCVSRPVIGVEEGSAFKRRLKQTQLFIQARGEVAS